MGLFSLKNIYTWLFRALCFAIPLSSYASVRLLAVLLVLSFVLERSWSRFSRVWTVAWDVFLYIGVMLIGMIYTTDLSTGWRSLETSFALLALPFVITVAVNIEKENLNKIYPMFMLGLLLSSTICIANAMYQFSLDGNKDHFFFYELTDVVGLQPTYMAYYIILCITYGLYLLYYDNWRIWHFMLAIAILFLFCMLILTSGQTAFIALMLAFSFFMLKYLVDSSNWQRHVVVVLTVAMLAGMLVYFNNSNLYVAESDYWERSVLWRSAVDANVNPMLGVGTGDYKSILNEYYIRHNMTDFAEGSFNAHNQWVQTYFSNGLIGILLMIFMFARPLFLAVRDKNALGILIFFPLIIYSMTEVILGRYQGVIFFILIHQVVTLYHFSNSPDTVLKPLQTVDTPQA
jgi:O-antigen ligase